MALDSFVRQHLFIFFCSIVSSFLLSACVGTRFLEGNEKLLYSQSLEGAKGLDKEEIESLYVNRPNKRVIFLPISPQVEIYQRGIRRFDPEKYRLKKEKLKKKYDRKIANHEGNEKKLKKYREKSGRKIDKLDKTIKEGNFGMRNGEPLAIFDSTLEETTIQKIKSYIHSNGYFKGNVTYEVEENETEKFVDITYKIEKGTPYTIDSIDFNIQDNTVRKLYKSTFSQSPIAKGKIYRQDNLIEERERINDLLLNNGYYDFNRQYLSFDVDSTLLEGNKIALRINIKDPKRKHKIFKIDSVIFTTDADITGAHASRQQLNFNNINYQFYRKRYSKKILDWRTFIYPDSIYSRERTFETQRQLSNLDIFKFINVNYDTTGGKFIANIFTSPLQKYQTSNEVGVNVSEGLPGPFVNVNFKNRNIFKGLEVMELNARIGFEGLGGVSEKGNGYSSLEYGGNVSFNFPQFLFPFAKDLKSRIGNLNPQTRLFFGLSFSDRPEFLRNNINSSITYSWQKQNHRQFNFTLADISYINSELTNEFDSLLVEFSKNGNNLINSFQPSFISSSIFTATYNFNDYGNRKERSSYFRYLIETGGNIFNVFGSSLFGSSLQYYQYAKFSTDYRSSRPLNSKVSLAYRFHLGMAVPYGANETLPYEKFFFAGGSNSIRAWAPRRLGPGSYTPLDSEGNYSDNFEQSGEILFESSMELRHQIFGFFYGALFLDAGNSWTLRNDDTRPGSQFQANRFYKEIALGAGYGFRFDFSFLLLRFDAGLKIYDPTGGPNQKFIWDEGLNDPQYANYRKLIWNIGIGYPF